MHNARTVLATLALAAVLLVALPGSAHAWKSDGVPIFKRGTGHAIGWHGIDDATRSEAREAVAHWNASGARLQLVEVARAKARIVVQPPEAARGCTGVASRAWANGARTMSEIRRGPCRTRDERVRILVHEFGHSLGLEHERRRCATMNTHLVDAVPVLCRDAQGLPASRYYCTYLESDDIRGIVARYGGRGKPPLHRICDRSTRPPAVLGAFAVALPSTLLLGSWGARIGWVQPRSPATIVRTTIHAGSPCPPAAGAVAAIGAIDVPVGLPGVRLVADMPAGSYCAVLAAHDRYGQAGDPAHVPFVVPESIG